MRSGNKRKQHIQSIPSEVMRALGPAVADAVREGGVSRVKRGEAIQENFRGMVANVTRTLVSLVRMMCFVFFPRCREEGRGGDARNLKGGVNRTVGSPRPCLKAVCVINRYGVITRHVKSTLSE